MFAGQERENVFDKLRLGPQVIRKRRDMSTFATQLRIKEIICFCQLSIPPYEMLYSCRLMIAWYFR